MSNIDVSWEEVENLIFNISKKIIESNFLPDIIVAVLRGGIVPARLLCNYFDKAKLFTITAKLYDKCDDWQTEQSYLHSVGAVKVSDVDIPIYGKENILIIDDISDSGNTLDAVFGEIYNKLKNNNDKNCLIKTASLFLRKKSFFAPDFYGEKVDHEIWFNFPWEKKNK